MNKNKSMNTTTAQDVPRTSAGHNTQAAGRPWPRRIAKLLMLAQVLYPLAGVAPARAQAQTQVGLAPSHNAPAGQRPIIDAAQNGVPIVHIAPPSAGGVSRNQYEQFNVGANGLILNNSSTNVQTQLGGWISGNMQLGPTPARIILNEVVSGSTSQLKGFIEVAGQRADIVIANPNGISCDGCGFLNTSGRATLTTGAALVNGLGQLSGFNVGRGQINIGSAGLNATNLERLDLIARGLVIEGEVWAKNLQVVTGANQVLYGTLRASSQGSAAAAPGFAIDIKELGGMYANQIYLVATEQGLGVNSTGRVAALQGNLSLSVNGDLTLKHSYAKQDIQLASKGNTTLTGVTQSEGSTRIQTTGTLVQQGVLASTGPLSLTATGLNNTGTLYSAGALSIAAAQVNDTNGKMISAGELNIAALDIALSGTQLSTDAKLTLAASAGNVSLTNAQVSAATDIAASASGSVANSGGFVQSGGSIAVQAGALANQGGTMLASGALRVSTSGAIDNTGGKLMGGTAVDLSAASLTNNASSTSQALVASEQGTRITTSAAEGISNRGGVLSGKTGLTVQTNGGALANGHGVVVSNSALELNAGAIDSSGGQIVSRGENGASLTIRAASLNNAGGVVNAAGALTITTSGAVGNTAGGSIQAGTAAPADLTLKSASFVNDTGTLTSSGAAEIITGDFTNTTGTVASNATTTITAGQASNKGGTIASSTGTSLHTQALDNSAGSITSAAVLAIDTHGQALTNTAGQLGANGSVDVISGVLSNAQGRIASANDRVAITATSVDNTGATISANTSATVQSSGAVLNAQGTIVANTATTVQGAMVDNTAGLIVANKGGSVVTAHQITNDQGVISGSTSATVASSQALSNRSGHVLAVDTVSVTATSLDNTGGVVSAQSASVDVGRGAIDNSAGQLIGATKLNLTNGAVTNARGQIVSGSDLNLDTQGAAFSNADGTLQATGALTLHASALNNSTGTINSQTALSIVTTGALNNVGGELSATKVAGNAASTGQVTIATNGQALDTSSGRIVAEGDLSLRAGSLNSTTSAGLIATNHDATFDVVSLANAGRVQAGNQLVLTAVGGVDNSGVIKAGQDMSLSAASLANQQATLQAGGNLRVSVDMLANTNAGQLLAAGTLQIVGLSDANASVNNAGGLVSASGAVTAVATTLVNDAGRIESGATTQISATSTTNRAGRITSATGTTLATQSFDNSNGELSSAAALTLNTHAQALMNQGGRIVSAQSLVLNTGAIDNSASGLIASTAGNAALTATSLVNDAGSISAKQSITASVAGAASNRGGAVIAGQALVLNAATLDNAQGQLVSNQGTVAVVANQLGNAQGLISAAQAVAVTSTAAPLDNSGGRILSDGTVTLKAAGLSNVGGTVSAQDMVVDVGTQTIDNSAGKLIGSKTLQLTHGELINRQGLIATAADLSLNTQGRALDNSAGQINADGVLTVRSGSLNNQAGVLTSGSAVSITSQALNNAQGQISAQQTAGKANSTGHVAIDTSSQQLDNTQGLIAGANQLSLASGALVNANGKIGATGAAAIGTLNVASLNNTDGTLSAGTLTLTSTGAITNAGGSLSASQDATITAQSLSNTASPTTAGQTGQLVAGRDLSLDVSGALANNAALVQSGRNATLRTGTLSNDAGVLDSHGTFDITSTGATSNRGGVIRTANAVGSSTAGALTLASASLDNSAGTVNAATALSVTTGELSNVNAGLLQASGGPLALASAQSNNQWGAIVSAGDINASTNAFDNTAGTVSAKGKLQLDTHGNALTNNAVAAQGASIQAGGAATIKSGALSNLAQGSSRAVIAAQDLTLTTSNTTNSGTIAAGGTNGVDGQLALTTSGALVNDGGSVQAQGSVTVQAQSLSNQGGKITAASSSASTAPALSITTTGALNNTNQGLIAALDGEASLNTQGAVFNNSAGSVYAKGALLITAGTADNSQGGSLQAGGALSATTLALNNTAGSVQAGSVTLNTQALQLTNDRGSIVSTGDVTLATGALSNNAGTLISIGRLGITAAGAVDNSAGLLSGAQGLALAATGHAVANSGGTIKSAQGDVHIAADAVNNDGGSIAAAGTTALNASTAISNRALTLNGASVQGQITGHDIVITTPALINTGGRIAADFNATITTTSTDNSSGEISAKNNVTLTAPTLVNTNGQIVANNALTVSTASSSLGGTLSGNDVTLTVQGDYTNTSTLTAKNKLTLSANNITNSGEISGTTTKVNATGTLTNSGLIDGTDTTVTVATLTNTGRIYGDQLKLGGASINNSGTGTIAARDSLALGAQSLSNTGAGLIYATNDIGIGGRLENGAVQGSMQTLLNASSTIEAGRDLTVSADSLINRNDAIQVGSTTTTLALNTTLIQPEGGTTKYSLDQLRWDASFEDIGHWVIDSAVYPISAYGLTTKLPSTTYGCTVSESGTNDICSTTLNYAATDPIWALFKVAPPNYSGLAAPSSPDPVGGCMLTAGIDASSERNSSGACGTYWTAQDAYIAAAAARDVLAYAALQVQISAFNADVSVRMFDAWNEYQITGRTTTAPVLISSSPAQMLAGRDLTLQGSVSKLNDNSNIVAGATLLISGSAVFNQGTDAVQTITDAGQVRHRQSQYHGGFHDNYSADYSDWAAIDPAPASSTITVAAYRYENHAANPTSTQALIGATPSGGTASGAGTVLATPVTNASAPTAPAAQSIVTGDAMAAGSQSVAVGAVTATSMVGTGSASAVSVSPGVAQVSTTTASVDIKGVRRVSAIETAAASPLAAASTATSVPNVQRYSVTGSDQKARDVILTVVPHLGLPTSSLFTIHSAPGTKYLVETDPRFINGQTFLGSDYLLALLNLDPERTLTRYGDGFEEQQLVNDQVLTLTGRRYLSGYTNTQDEYADLMNAGVAFARQYQLSPGVALSAEQMALLTTDIVWLTTQSVTLADGSTRKVLVPELYIRRPQAQDLSTSGALLAGSNVFIQSPGDLVNKATIQGDIVTLAGGRDIVNSGTVRGQDVYARAERDLNNLGGSFIGAGETSTLAFSAGRDIVLQTTTLASQNADASSTRTNIDRIATVQGGTVTMRAARDLIAQGASVNAATELQATAGRDIAITAAQASYQISTSTGGRMAGPDGVHAGRINETSTTQQVSNFSAGTNATLIAQGDVRLSGSNLTAGANAYVQGVNISVEAAKASTNIDVQTVGRHGYERATSSDQTLAGGKLTAGTNLSLVATGTLGADGKAAAGTGNISITGATLTAKEGQAGLSANNDVTIQAATTEHSTASESFYQTSSGVSGLYKSSERSQAQRTSQTSQLEASSISGNSVLIQAGDPDKQSGDKQSGDIKLIASNINSTGATRLSAGRDVLITSAEQLSSRSEQEQSERSTRIGTREMEQGLGFIQRELLRPDPIASKYIPAPALHGSTNERVNGQTSATQSIASSISADSLSITAGRDATVRGSALVATNNLGIDARRDLLITTSQDQQSSSNSRSKNDEGVFTGSDSLNNGLRQVSQAANNTSSTATASQVASLSGNVKLNAGQTYRQTGSQVLALGQASPDSTAVSGGGDIDITAKHVFIEPAGNTKQSADSTNYKQEGTSVTMSGPLISALKSLSASASNAGKTEDSRMQVLAAATAAMNAYDAASAVAAGQGGASTMGISVDLVHIQSQTKNSAQSDQTVASTVSGARDVRITATGAGKAGSHISIEGSDINAGRDAVLKADGKITLQAASNSNSLRQSNSAQNANIGITYGGGSQSGLSFHGGASASQGKAVGDEQTWRNTHIAAGNSVSVQSGGDTTLKGAVLAANTVNADIGGKLSIQSLQDSSKFDAKQNSAGASVSLCIPPICYGEFVSGSLSASKARVNGDFSGVVEQSGIKAGDGGFHVKVAGHTDLQGGAIVSSQGAIDAGNNSFSTATLSSSDLGNKDKFAASGYSASYSGGSSGSGGGTAGFTSKSGEQSSVTRSAISAGVTSITDEKAQQSLTGKDSSAAIAKLDTQATTDSATSATLNKAWDGAKLMQQTQLNTQIVAAFNGRAAKAVGDYAASQQQDLQAQAEQARKSGDTAKADQLQGEAKLWAEGGAYRVAAHIAVGGLAGGVAGALGAGASAAAAPMITEAMNKLDAPAVVKGAVGAAVAAAIGAISSGGNAVGAMTAVNADLNNRQLHPNERTIIEKLAKDKATQTCQSGNTQCINSQTIFWSDTLEKVAKGSVDDKANAENLAYLNQLVVASQQPNSEGARGQLAAYVQSLKDAQNMLTPYVGKIILVNGQPAVADGSAQTNFSATAAQRTDPYGNYVLGVQAPGNLVPGTAQRDEARLENMGAINGAVKPDTTLEETLLGNRLLNSLGKTLSKAIAAAPISDAAEVAVSKGGNIAASQVTTQGTRATFSSTEAALMAQVNTLPNVTLQGDLRELVVENFFTRNGFTSLNGKCGSNCFDGVFTQGDKVYLVETKPLRADGSIRLSPENTATGLQTQMSDMWIESALRRLAGAGDQSASVAATIRAALDNGSLVKLVVGVDSNGLSMVKLPKTKP
jgi:filamentous hemagglutinin